VPLSDQQPDDAELAAAALPEQGEAIDIWEFTSDAVADILECADIAVEAIVDRTEQQVFEDIELAEDRAEQETERRRLRLARLRHQLASRAAQLADSYASIAAELDLLDQALSQLGPTAPPPLEATPPAVATVRESTIRFAGQASAPADEQLAAAEPTARPPVHDARIPWQDAA
jgi:hypothetical protein